MEYHKIKECSNCYHGDILSSEEYPCALCRGHSYWEPRCAKQIDKESKRSNARDAVLKIEEVLNSMDIYWSISYMPCSDSYNVYISNDDGSIEEE